MPYKDPERRRAYGREWMKRNAEKAREAMRRWRQRHPEHRYQRDRAYRDANRDRVRKWDRTYAAKHPDVIKEKRERRRARLAGAVGTYTQKEWRARLTQYNDRCAYCGAPGPLQPDHDVPLARGGSNDIANVVPACPTCNHRKRAMTGYEFMLLLALEQGDGTLLPYFRWWVRHPEWRDWPGSTRAAGGANYN